MHTLLQPWTEHKGTLNVILHPGQVLTSWPSTRNPNGHSYCCLLMRKGKKKPQSQGFPSFSEGRMQAPCWQDSWVYPVVGSFHQSPQVLLIPEIASLLGDGTSHIIFHIISLSFLVKKSGHAWIYFHLRSFWVPFYIVSQRYILGVQLGILVPSLWLCNSIGQKSSGKWVSNHVGIQRSM